MKYLASVAVPMIAGYLYDKYQTIVYYISGSFSFLGVISVIIAWRLISTETKVYEESKDHPVDDVCTMPSSSSPAQDIVGV
jgi:hypothetical protein